MNTVTPSLPEEFIRNALTGQYHATLAMLRATIVACSDELWFDETPRNACWRIAHHTLFFVHLYLLDRPADFVPPEWHDRNVQNPDGLVRPTDPASTLPLGPRPYPKAQMLTYLAWCDALVDERVAAMDITSQTSGFAWYPIPKLEHQLVTIRHTAYHAGQLADRLRSAQDVGVPWVDSGHSPEPPPLA